MNSKMKNLGRFVKSTRLTRGLTQAGLAKKLKISQPQISKIERGQAGMGFEDGVKILAFIGEGRVPGGKMPEQASFGLRLWLG